MRAGVCARARVRTAGCVCGGSRPAGRLAVVGQEGRAGARGLVNHYRILCACSSYLRSLGLYTMMGLVGSTCTMRSMPLKIVCMYLINVSDGKVPLFYVTVKLFQVVNPRVILSGIT